VRAHRVAGAPRRAACGASLACALSLALACSRDDAPRRAPAGEAPAAGAPAAPALPGEEAAQLARLGYLTGYREAEGPGGVSRFDPARAWPGWNLYSSGHAPEARLIDMQGALVHRWQIAYRDAFPAADDAVLAKPGTRYLRRVLLAPDGGLFALFDYFGLVRLDRDSRVLWARALPVHHDFYAAGERLFVLSEQVHEVPSLRPGRRVREDLILELDAQGRELRRVSLLRALERSRFAARLAHLPRHDDLFHTNTLVILDGAHAERVGAFRAGNALVSIRNLDLLAVVDLAREVVVWAAQGGWRLQHEPSLLANGNLLLFDNLGLRGRSRVLEVEPLGGRVAWSWAGEGAGFLSEGMGAAQRLPNSNTLVTDSFGGRVFEVTREGDVVWRFDNPARTGERGERVAVVPEMRRLDPERDAAGLRGAAPPPRSGR